MWALLDWEQKTNIMWLNLAAGGEQGIWVGIEDKLEDLHGALERGEGSQFELCPSIQSFPRADLLYILKCNKPFSTQAFVYHWSALLAFQMADSFPSCRSQLT